MRVVELKPFAQKVKSAKMRMLMAGLLIAGLTALPVLADDDEILKERKEKFQKISTDFIKAREKLAAKIREAETRAEKKEILAKELPNLKKFVPKFMALVNADPKSEFALTTLMFIIKEVDAEQAAVYGVLAAHHAKSPKMKEICAYFLQGGPKEAVGLLEKVLAENPDKTIQGYACSALGRTLVLQGQEGDKKLLAEGEKYLERVVKEYGDIKMGDTTLGAMTKGLLFELRHLAIGMKAPDTASQDLKGDKVKLSDYAGKVVVLDIWATWCGPCKAMIPHERQMVKKFKDKPFTLISLSADQEKGALEMFLKKEDMPWVHWWQDPTEGLVNEWNVESFPTIYVMDAKGIIRYKNVRGDELEEAVETLLKEAEKK